MDIGLFGLLVLVIYRAAYMVTQEEGPFGVFAQIRGALDPDQATWLGRGINCIYCVSFWFAFVATLLFAPSLLWWFALAGAVVVLDKVVDQ